MPGWLQVFVVVALAAVVVLQLMILRQSLDSDALDPIHAELLDLLRELAEVFRGWPDAYGVLDEIVAQFRTNTGHSMRDLLDRLDRAATVAATAAESSAAAVSRLLTLVALGAATGLRIEEHAEGVADDLRHAQSRADAIVDGDPGESADAASCSPTTPEHVSTTDSIGETHERP